MQERKGKLLVVDDEVETLTPLSDLLSEWGYDVTMCTSGKDALEAFREQSFDVLITDLVMPEMDGIELIREATKLDLLLVSIVITGHGTIQTAVEAMKNGAYDYIMKPIEWKLLRTIISRAVETSRLRESEKRYRSVVEDQTELICRSKPGGIITFVNEACCRYFNKKPEELIGRSFMEFIPEEDHGWVRRQFADLSPHIPVVTCDHRVFLTDGSIGWQHWTNRAFFDEKGNIIEYQSVGCDITERKLTEKALKDSEEKFRELADSITDVFFAMDEDLKYIYWNKASENLTGVSEKDAIGKSIYDIFPDTPEIRNAERVYREVLITRQPRNFITEYQIGDKDYTFEINAYPSKKGLSVFVTDITERKRTEKALQESEERYRLHFENVNDVLYSIDTELRIISVSPSVERILGYKCEELIGQRFGDLNILAPQSLKAAVTDTMRILSGETISASVYEFITMDGSKKFGEVSGSPLFRDGKIVAVVSVARDITERKEAEEKLKKSHELLRALSIRLSEVEEAERKRLAQELHDQVGQNLTAIGINLNNLPALISPGEAAKIQERVKDIQKLLAETTQSIRDVMSELRPPVLDDFGLAACINWYGNRFSERTGIGIKMRGKVLKPRLPAMLETVLYRIVQEALTNIAKHSKAGSIEIILKESQGTVKLVISDDGIGFSPETVYKTKMWKAWGLHTMRERAEAMGGSFRIRSKPGKGTKVIVEIKRTG